MAYIALYRNYRPQVFDDVVGQKVIVQTLKNAVINDKISHAYLFTGQRGVGKTTLARILAKAINCLDLHDGNACLKCDNCQLINDNSTPDIIEIDAASNNGVDEMRELLEKVNFLPATLKKKIYIIDEVHMLSTSAFNALLKTLEEPPHHVVFILATTEPHKVPSTIMSRCQRFDFLQLSLGDISSRLRYIADKENIQITDDAILSIAEHAEGGMRDAIGTLDQVSSFIDKEITIDDVDLVTGKIGNLELIKLIKALYEKNSGEALSIVNSLLNNGKETNRIVTDLIQCCRDILLYKTSSNLVLDKNIYKKEEFLDLVKMIDNYSLFYYLDILMETSNKLKYTNSPKLYLEIAILKIISYYTDSDNIATRLHDIEETLQNASFSNNKLEATDLELKVGELNLQMKKVINEMEKLDFVNFKTQTQHSLQLLESKVIDDGNTDLINRLNALENRLNLLKNQPISEKSEIVEAANFDSDIYIKKDEIKGIITEEEKDILNLIENIQIKLAEQMKELTNKVDALMNQALENQDLAIRIEKIKEKMNSLTVALDDINNKSSVINEPKEQEPIINSEEMVSDEKESLNNSESPQEEVKEEIELVKETVIEEKAEEIIEKEESNSPIVEDTKPFKTVQDVYNIDIISKTLGESFDRSLRELKAQMVQEWPQISLITEPKYISTAKLLANGVLQVVGKTHLILIYPSAPLCNRLMSDVIHPIACEIINAVYGQNYDFIALPQNTWLDIRRQYTEQYSQGLFTPRLQPINNPDLQVITTIAQTKDVVYDLAKELFGEDKVRKEE